MSHPGSFARPDPLAIRRIVDWPIAFVGALLAHPGLLHVDDAVRHAGGARGGWAAVSLCTAAVSVVHLRLASKAKTPGGAFARSVILGMLLGPLNSGLSLAAVVALEEGFGGGVFGAFLLGALFGSVAGAGLGILFGVAYSPLVVATSVQRERPTHAGPEKVRALVGAMLMAAAAVHHAFIEGSIEIQVIGALLGAAQLGFALHRLTSLELFLRAVRGGKEPKWSLAPARDAGDAAGLTPIHARGEPGVILYRATGDDASSPYRSQQQWLPVARLAA